VITVAAPGQRTELNRALTILFHNSNLSLDRLDGDKVGLVRRLAVAGPGRAELEDLGRVRSYYFKNTVSYLYLSLDRLDRDEIGLVRCLAVAGPRRTELEGLGRVGAQDEATRLL
jgi:hypothetical protein